MTIIWHSSNLSVTDYGAKALLSIGSEPDARPVCHWEIAMLGESHVAWWGWVALVLIVTFNAGLIGGLCLILWRTYKNAPT